MELQEAARHDIAQLVARYRALSSRERKEYNEAATRQGFILPLFRALGWNVDDPNEVKPEEQVSRGFVDFAFRIGGVAKFFLETKKIPEDLSDPRWARQAINVLNLEDPAERAMHDRMVVLVEEMLRLKREHAEAEAALEDRRHDLARAIERTDREIDRLVYQLYGLTEDEIAIVEGQSPQGQPA
ncbi:MAG: hypothetical protein QHH80_07080 [Anaerolineae bacterium]|nr:hypothetical protein [Anaerolineae bacterium]